MSTTRPDPFVAERGFAIVSAIFILVVLAALGGYIVSTSSTQNLSLAQDALNSRAAQAARAGLGWGTYQVTRASTFRSNCIDPNASYTGPTPASQTFSVGELPGLTEFRVDVICRSNDPDYNEAGEFYRVFRIEATACTATGGCPAASVPTIGYVEHRQAATIRQ